MLRRPAAARWVDVELEGRSGNGGRALVQLPASIDAYVGDVVVVQLASPKSIDMARAEPPIRVSRVTEVRARASQLALP
jgi:hypothetical protein